MPKDNLKDNLNVQDGSDKNRLESTYEEAVDNLFSVLQNKLKLAESREGKRPEFAKFSEANVQTSISEIIAAYPTMPLNRNTLLYYALKEDASNKFFQAPKQLNYLGNVLNVYSDRLTSLPKPVLPKYAENIKVPEEDPGIIVLNMPKPDPDPTFSCLRKPSFFQRILHIWKKIVNKEEAKLDEVSNNVFDSLIEEVFIKYKAQDEYLANVKGYAYNDKKRIANLGRIIKNVVAKHNTKNQLQDSEYDTQVEEQDLIARLNNANYKTPGPIAELFQTISLDKIEEARMTAEIRGGIVTTTQTSDVEIPKTVAGTVEIRFVDFDTAKKFVENFCKDNVELKAIMHLSGSELDNTIRIMPRSKAGEIGAFTYTKINAEGKMIPGETAIDFGDSKIAKEFLAKLSIKVPSDRESSVLTFSNLAADQYVDPKTLKIEEFQLNTAGQPQRQQRGGNSAQARKEEPSKIKASGAVPNIFEKMLNLFKTSSKESPKQDSLPSKYNNVRSNSRAREG